MSGRNSAPPLPPEISEAAANPPPKSRQRSAIRIEIFWGRGAELPLEMRPDAPTPLRAFLLRSGRGAGSQGNAEGEASRGF